MRATEPLHDARCARDGRRAVVGILLVSAVLIPRVAGARAFSLGSWTGFTEIGFDLQDQSQTSLEGERPLFERTVNEQRLGFRNKATFVSRRFLTVDFGLTLGLLQSHLTNASEPAASGEGRLRGFDLGATVMPLKSYGFNFLAGRVESVTPIEYAGSRRLETSNFSLTMQVGPKFFPARLSYRDAKLESTSDLGQLVRGLDQSTRTFSYRAENRWGRNEAYAFLQYQEVDDRVANSFSNETTTASLNHTVDLLEPKLATLRSSVRYFDRMSALPSSSFHIDEELRLRHSDNLTSGLRYELRDLDNFSGLASTSRRKSAWIHHRLWESLETDLRIGRASSSTTAGGTDQDDARLQLNYTKNLPKGGRLLGRFGSTYERRDSLRGDGQLLITRERHLLRFGVASRLDHPAVIPGTVVVTDELETTIFEENVEYELRFIGEFAEILPIPGGRITDGQPTFVEYRVEAPAMSEFTSHRNDFNLSIDYTWIMPFFGYQSSSDDLRQGLPNSLLDDRTERFAGIRFRKSGRRLKLVSFNEVRSRKSGLLAFESLRLADGVSYSPAPHWTLTANLVHMVTDFETPTREVQVDDGRLGVRWRPIPALSLESYASTREISDTLAADQTFDRVGLAARWNLGKMSLIGSAERWQRQRNGIDLDGMTASLKLSRRFFPGTLTARRWAPEPEPWPADLPGLAPDPFEEEASWEQDDPLAAESTSLFDQTNGYGSTNQPPTVAASKEALQTAMSVVAEPAPAPAGFQPTATVRAEIPPTLENDIRAAVEDWASVWASQDIDRYVSPYAKGASPAEVMSRDAGERLRRSRLSSLQWIEIRLDTLAVEDLGGGRARATLNQTSRYDLYSNVAEKTLELIRDDGEWKIVAEIARASGVTVSAYPGAYE